MPRLQKVEHGENHQQNTAGDLEIRELNPQEIEDRLPEDDKEIPMTAATAVRRTTAILRRLLFGVFGASGRHTRGAMPAGSMTTKSGRRIRRKSCNVRMGPPVSQSSVGREGAQRRALRSAYNIGKSDERYAIRTISPPEPTIARRRVKTGPGGKCQSNNVRPVPQNSAAASGKRAVPAKPPVTPPVTEVRRARPVRPKERRDFFSDAMKEVLSPFAGVLERKINPLLSAIESIPEQAERLAKMEPPKLDQIHIGKYSLPIGKSEPAKKAREVERYLRPPGAMESGTFETVCSRCAKCVEACPAEAIQLDPNHLTAEGFPYIVPADQPCVVVR